MSDHMINNCQCQCIANPPCSYCEGGPPALTDQELREIVDNPDAEMLPDATVEAMARELLANRARIAELEAAQRDPVGYVVGHQHDGATLLQFGPAQVDPFGDRACAYATRGEAQAFAVKCGPYDPRTEFNVYELRKAAADE